ncbi:MAG: DUF4329 domain-containing protein [Pseudomonadota bacterium]
MLRYAVLSILLVTSPALANDLQRVAAGTLAALQSNSFAENREFCGLIGRLPDGTFVASPARRGRMDSCTPRVARNWQPEAEIVASYHTHGAFDPEADSEIPSIDDILSDSEEGIDGYISTPGGRLWFVDGDRVEARLICDIGCLPADPAFRPGLWGPVATRYDPASLRRRDAQ